MKRWVAHDKPVPRIRRQTAEAAPAYDPGLGQVLRGRLEDEGVVVDEVEGQVGMKAAQGPRDHSDPASEVEYGSAKLELREGVDQQPGARVQPAVREDSWIRYECLFAVCDRERDRAAPVAKTRAQSLRLDLHPGRPDPAVPASLQRLGNIPEHPLESSSGRSDSLWIRPVQVEARALNEL